MIVRLGFGHRMYEKDRIELGFYGFDFGGKVIYVCVVCIFSFFEVLGSDG